MTDVITIARPYAKAIFELAFAHKTLQEWKSMLTTLALIASDKNMQSMLFNPLLSKEQLAKLFLDVAKDTVNEEGKRFVEQLANKSRLSLLPAIRDRYETLLAEHEKTIDVKVVSAYPLDKDRLKKLQKALQNFLNRQVTMQFDVDSTLLGGVIIHAGDQVIDGSLRGRLHQLSESLSS